MSPAKEAVSAHGCGLWSPQKLQAKEICSCARWSPGTVFSLLIGLRQPGDRPALLYMRPAGRPKLRIMGHRIVSHRIASPRSQLEHPDRDHELSHQSQARHGIFWQPPDKTNFPHLVCERDTPASVWVRASATISERSGG